MLPKGFIYMVYQAESLLTLFHKKISFGPILFIYYLVHLSKTKIRKRQNPEVSIQQIIYRFIIVITV